MTGNFNTPQFTEFRTQVISFAKEDVPTFIPNSALIKEMWLWGVSAGNAADNCVRDFRKQR